MKDLCCVLVTAVFSASAWGQDHHRQNALMKTLVRSVIEVKYSSFLGEFWGGLSPRSGDSTVRGGTSYSFFWLYCKS